jgi:hypothetical protein
MLSSSLFEIAFVFYVSSTEILMVFWMVLLMRLILMILMMMRLMMTSSLMTMMIPHHPLIEQDVMHQVDQVPCETLCVG